MKTKKSVFSSIARFSSSHKGQRFFNMAYSIGAAIVICGVLFKLLYLPYADILLAIGLGTEIIMFILTAFDFAAEQENNKMKPDSSETEQTAIYSEHDIVTKEKAEELAREMDKMIQNLKKLNEVYSGMLSTMKGNLNNNNE